MNFRVVVLLACVLLGFLSTSTSALSRDEAIAMRTRLEDEMRIHKKKDREMRMRAKGSPQKQGKDEARARKERPVPKTTRALQKLLNVKLNILHLAEDADEADLDAMLALYERMVELQGLDQQEAAALDVEERRAKTAEMKSLRHQLDSIAQSYGGLKGERPGRHNVRQKHERAFSEEEARTVKELRRKIKESTDEQEEAELREQLQSLYAEIKFSKKSEHQKRKDALRKEMKGDMTDRHHARKAASRRARVEKGDPSERLSRPDRGNVKLKGSVRNAGTGRSE